MMRDDCPSTCPFVADSEPRPFDFPVGQIRRVAPNDRGEVDETKRNILKLLAIAGVVGAAGGGLVGGALQYVQPPSVGVTPPYITALLDTDGTALTVDKVEAEYNINTSSVILFNYPLQNEPNFLLNLQGNSQGIKNVPGGIGTDGTIVAYSAICQHLGCTAPAIMFYPPGLCPGKTFSTPEGTIDFFIHCSCHGSTYDPANKASNLTGPAVLPLPQIILQAAADGAISAVGFTSSSPPVNGHVTSYTGDYGVGTTSGLSKQAQGPILCSFP